MKVRSVALCTLLAISVSGAGTASARAHRDDGDNRYGGPVYTGAPDLVSTGTFLSAGGGAKTFTIRTALNNVIGVQLVDPELDTLRKQYGAAAVGSWLQVFEFVFRDAAAQAATAGVALPLASATHTGKALFIALMQDGTAGNGTFWTGTMLDKLVTHHIHMQTMHDIDAKYGPDADAAYHKITNQFVYDVAVQLGLGDDVKLAPDH